MKNLNVTFEDEDFKKIERAKNRSKLIWEKFILELVKCYEKLII